MKNVPFYICIIILAIYSQMAIQIFSLYVIPVFLFFIFIFSFDKKGIKSPYTICSLIVSIGSIIYLNPVNYLFTFLIFYMSLVYLLDKKFKSLYPQIIVNISFLIFLSVKPGYVLVFFMHYQRFLLQISGAA